MGSLLKHGSRSSIYTTRLTHEHTNVAAPHGSFHKLQLNIYLHCSAPAATFDLITFTSWWYDCLDLVGLDGILLWSHVGVMVITRHGLIFNVLTTSGRQSNKISNIFIKLKIYKLKYKNTEIIELQITLPSSLLPLHWLASKTRLRI